VWLAPPVTTVVISRALWTVVESCVEVSVVGARKLSQHNWESAEGVVDLEVFAVEDLENRFVISSVSSLMIKRVDCSNPRHCRWFLAHGPQTGLVLSHLILRRRLDNQCGSDDIYQVSHARCGLIL